MSFTLIDKLIGETTEYPRERDEEEFKIQQEQAYKKYLFKNIIESIGTFDIKINFLTVINEISELPEKDQKMFSTDLLNKVKEVYEYEPYLKSMIVEPEIRFVYDFVKFLEFDNILFLSKLWEILKEDLRKINIKEYCMANKERIAKEVDELIEWNSYNEYINDFLRTYHMNDLARWISESTEKNKMLITLTIEERKQK